MGPTLVLPDAQITEVVRADHRETRDDYRGELFRHGPFRVAICRDSIQWLLQRQRHRFPAGGAAWDTLHYCTTREALARLHRAHIGDVAPEIAALPEYFRRVRNA